MISTNLNVTLWCSKWYPLKATENGSPMGRFANIPNHLLAVGYLMPNAAPWAVSWTAVKYDRWFDCLTHFLRTKFYCYEIFEESKTWWNHIPNIRAWLMTPPNKYPAKMTTGHDWLFITNSITNWMSTKQMTFHLNVVSTPNNFLICGYFS